MSSRIIFQVLSRVIMAAALACAATSGAAARNVTITLMSNGVLRDADVYLPSTYNANERFPVILAFHPANGTGAEMEKLTGLDAQADKFRFVVVYPDSNGPRWDNVGTSDLQFVPALLVALAGKLSLDPQRVYASGYSDGGGFAQLLVCTQATTYAGLATVGINMGNAEEAKCRPAQPFTYLTFHGTADPYVPYDGGVTAGPYSTGNITNSTLQVFHFWAEKDGCTSALPVRKISDRLATGPKVSDVVLTTSPCLVDTAATFYTIPGGGHTWPGGTQLPTVSLGDVSMHLNASEIILQTLSPHRSAAANACFEGAAVPCRIANGKARQTCIGGHLGACTLTACDRGFVPRNGSCFAR